MLLLFLNSSQIRILIRIAGVFFLLMAIFMAVVVGRTPPDMWQAMIQLAVALDFCFGVALLLGAGGSQSGVSGAVIRTLAGAEIAATIWSIVDLWGAGTPTVGQLVLSGAHLILFMLIALWSWRLARERHS